MPKEPQGQKGPVDVIGNAAFITRNAARKPGGARSASPPGHNAPLILASVAVAPVKN
jgi:hypothetical protein